jgi:general secretion pathway protein G
MKQSCLNRVIIPLIILFLCFAGFGFYSLSVFSNQVRHSKEIILKQNLEAMRYAIKNYAEDKQRAPQSLQQLVESGYLRIIPTDPLTRSANTWITEMEEKPFSPGVPPGIKDVHSNAAGADAEGKPYRAY